MKRSSLFDNMKIFLILLVVFGHCLEEISLISGYGVIRAWLYSFHMPAFLFISGYFSKHTKVEKTIINCAVPFFLYNTLFVLLLQHKLKVDIFMPKYIFWYFFCLLIWRLCVDDLKKIKGIFFISILLGLYIGIFKDADRFMSISRIFAFLPYFLMGVFMDEEKVKRIRELPKLYAIVTSIVLSGLVVLLHIKDLIPVKAYENIQCYHASGMGNLHGILVRLLTYAVGMIAVICILNLMPDKENPCTVYGSRTAVIYIASGFLVKILYDYFLDKALPEDFLARHLGAGLLSAIVIALAITLVFGHPFFSEQYAKINKKIGSLIIKA